MIESLLIQMLPKFWMKVSGIQMGFFNGHHQVAMAQMAERVAMNSDVRRSSPRPGSKWDRACKYKPDRIKHRIVRFLDVSSNRMSSIQHKFPFFLKKVFTKRTLHNGGWGLFLKIAPNQFKKCLKFYCDTVDQWLFRSFLYMEVSE